ncbi:MAG TPA: RHS repeat-associated core domain-containing protein [Fimbriimonadaceae bacterium]|nr:RHS repeat-associated core domain-containing protein [Fimbriimonadaceae bacterium]
MNNRRPGCSLDVCLIKTVSASNGATFTYRPDGLRADKIKSHVLSWNVTGEDSGYYDEDEDTNQPTTRYYYDGQMTVEEDYLESVVNDPLYVVTQYALGARGIDGVRKYDEINDESWYYPVYDGHGNQIATLARSGSSFALDNERLFDAWGVVKTGASSGGPTNRFVASIGHQQGDESGLIYMRARYYETWTGRFVSEDPAMAGLNWFVYCSNDPVNRTDRSGAVDDWSVVCLMMGTAFAVFAWDSMNVFGAAITKFALKSAVRTAISYMEISVGFFMLALGATANQLSDPLSNAIGAAGFVAGLGLTHYLSKLQRSLQAASKFTTMNGIGAAAAKACFVYAMLCIAGLICIETLE